MLMIFGYLIGTNSSESGAAIVTDQTCNFASPCYYNMQLLHNTSFCVEYDGSIALDWEISENRRFSLSIGPNDNASWAWINGAESRHGVSVCKELTLDWFKEKYEAIAL